jgi:hypothetical protein
MQKSFFLFYVGLFLVLMNSVTLASFLFVATHVDEVSRGKTRYGNLGIKVPGTGASVVDPDPDTYQKELLHVDRKKL